MSSNNNLLPIIFDSGAQDWIVEGKNDNDQVYSHARGKCLEEHDNTCSFCGFKTNKTHLKGSGMEILHIDGNGSNNAKENLLPACPYCRMCFNLTYAGNEAKAFLAWLPEIEQYEISYLYRIYFTVKHKKEEMEKSSNKNVSALTHMTNISEASEKLNAAIIGRAQYAERILGTSRPEELGRVLETFKKSNEDYGGATNLFKNGMSAGTGKNGEQYKAVQGNKSEDLYQKAYEQRAKILDGIRLIPTQIAFEPSRAGSGSNNYRGLVATWMSLAQNIFNKEQEEE